jgi:phosphoglycolate phosphatase
MPSLSIFSLNVAELTSQPIEAVLFDLDGTLIDSVPDLAAAIDVMLQGVGKSPAGETKVSRWVGNGAPALVKRALADRDSVDQEIESKEFASAYSVFESAYAERLASATGLYEGVIEVLSALSAAKIKLGLITNKPRRFTLPLLSALNIRDVFDDVICGDDFEHKKPHPLPLQNALKNLHCKPEQAIMVGDSISDIKAAASAGVKSVAVTYGYNHGMPITDARNDVQADVFIDRIQQLLR